MKKILVFILVFFISINICAAEERFEVIFNSCIDGDTANVLLDGEEIKIRFLAIDTPETKHPTKGEEPFGKEASEFTCNKLTNAAKIEIEYDSNSDNLDKYDRHLVWVWVDGYLLQDEIIKEGLAEVAYLYGDYKYNGILEDHQTNAKANKAGIWRDLVEETLEESNSGEEIAEETSKETEKEKDYLMIGLIIGTGIVLLLTGKLNKSKLKKLQKGLKKYGA